METMPSNNPVFRNSDQFKPGYNAYGDARYAGNGSSYAGYGDPSTWSVGSPGAGTGTARTRTSRGPMTIDTVVQATGISIGVVVVAAIVTWIVTPDVMVGGLANTAGIGKLYTLTTIGGLAALVLSLVNSFKRITSPALVVLFAAAEGVALGGLSKVFDAAFGAGVISGAVLGTFAAFAGTLAAYKIFDVKIGNKFRMMVTGAMFGLVGLMALDLLLSLFGHGLGLFGFGPLGFLTALAGVVLGVFMLVMDFDFVQQGIRNGLDSTESWRAAFAMTVSLIWIYTNLLRLIAIFTNNN